MDPFSLDKYNTDIVLCDEPTANLDEKNKKFILKKLKKLSLEGKIVIIVSHDISFLSYATEHIEFK